jgi:hypothetical protein
MEQMTASLLAIIAEMKAQMGSLASQMKAHQLSRDTRL